MTEMGDYGGSGPGGRIPGPDFRLTAVEASAPAGGGSIRYLYADECVVNRDMMCIRRDAWHRAARPRPDASWICPLHEDRPQPRLPDPFAADKSVPRWIKVFVFVALAFVCLHPLLIWWFNR